MLLIKQSTSLEDHYKYVTTLIEVRVSLKLLNKKNNKNFKILTQEIGANSFHYLSLFVGVDKPFHTQGNLQLQAHQDQIRYHTE